MAADSSTLISLAWAGQLGVLRLVPITIIVPDEVRQEVVVGGLARGYPDAAAIERAIEAMPSGASATPAEAPDTVDDAVLQAGRACGALLTNDLALGRRAANLGVRWLRTADLIVLCVRTRRLPADQAVAAVKALHDAGRITADLLDAYLEELS